MAALIRTSGRYLRTAAPLGLGQIGWRAKQAAARAFHRLAPQAVSERVSLRAAAQRPDVPQRRGARLQTGIGFALQAPLLREDWQEVGRRAQDVLEGRFTFAGHTVQLAPGSEWDARAYWAEASRLWRFHLHYFDYAVDLALAERRSGSGAAYRRLVELVTSWCRTHPLERAGRDASDAWHPYPTSLRIVSWILAWDLLAERIEADGAFRDLLAASLWEQAAYLERHLEWDLRGNHLLKNAKALAFAGGWLSGARADRWLARGFNLLWSQARKQILADGGHYERSPMYHLVVLQDYLEAMALARTAGVAVPGDVQERVGTMIGFVRSICHEDGEIPLFGDSVLGQAPPAHEVVAFGAAFFGDARLRPDGPLPLLAARWLEEPAAAEYERWAPAPQPSGFWSLPEGGFHVWRTEAGAPEARLILRCGAFGPAEQPGHAHADALSYELSIGASRFVVDGGTSDYATGPWRSYFRSTRAHNTVCLDGADQSEVWSAFRVGRRAEARVVASRTAPDGTAILTGEHTGYHPLGATHRRTVALVAGCFWLVLDEVLPASASSFGRRGTGLPCRVESLVRFAPDLQVEAVAAGSTIQVYATDTASVGGRLRLVPLDLGSGVTTELLSAAPAGAAPGSGAWYAPRFGERIPIRQAVLRVAGSIPLRLAYLLLPGAWADAAVDVTTEADTLKVSVANEAASLVVAIGTRDGSVTGGGRAQGR